MYYDDFSEATIENSILQWVFLSSQVVVPALKVDVLGSCRRHNLASSSGGAVSVVTALHLKNFTCLSNDAELGGCLVCFPLLPFSFLVPGWFSGGAPHSRISEIGGAINFYHDGCLPLRKERGHTFWRGQFLFLISPHLFFPVAVSLDLSLLAPSCGRRLLALALSREQLMVSSEATAPLTREAPCCWRAQSRNPCSRMSTLSKSFVRLSDFDFEL